MSHSARRIAVAVKIAILIGMGACIHRPAVDADGAPDPCAGARYVDVDNALQVPVNVYTFVEGAGMLLGTVPPGSQRIVLPARARYVHATLQNGKAIANERSRASAVRLTIGCDLN